MSELEALCHCLDALEKANKLLDLGAISPEEYAAVIHISRTWLDAVIAPAMKSGGSR